MRTAGRKMFEKLLLADKTLLEYPGHAPRAVDRPRPGKGFQGHPRLGRPEGLTWTTFSPSTRARPGAGRSSSTGAAGPSPRPTRSSRNIFPRPGWVEHDPEEIWRSVYRTIQKALAIVPGRTIVAVGITNQRETTVVWDRKTGRPVGNAIVWQCRRTAGRCRELNARKGSRPARPGQNGPADRRLLLGHQGGVDPRPGRSARAGRARRPRFRHDGFLGPLEAHRRREPRHRFHQRLPDHALQYP